MRNPVKTALLLLMGCLLVPASHAANEPVAQVSVEPETVTVGRPITLRVTVFVPTWFLKPPEFPNFELPNTITRLPANSSRPISRRVGTETWSGIQRRYQVFPLVAGSFVLRDRSLSLTYADPQSRAPLSADLRVPDVRFDATVPAGAESLDPFLAGESFELRRVLEADVENLAAGGALVVRYRAAVDGLPSLFLPPLADIPDQPGLAVYVAEPVLSDVDGRAVREEKVTLVFDGGGTFTLPELEMNWWNLRSERIDTARLDPLELVVDGPPAQTAASPAAESNRGYRLLAAGVPLLLLLFVMRKRLRRLIAARRRAREQYRHSELFAFRQLARALAAKDPRLSYNALLIWLAKLDARAHLEGFCAASGDEVLAQQVESLRSIRFAQSEAEVDFALLREHLSMARDAFLARSCDLKGGRRRPPSASALPALNP